MIERQILLHVLVIITQIATSLMGSKELYGIILMIAVLGHLLIGLSFMLFGGRKLT